MNCGKFIKKAKQTKGTSLLELLVAITLFAIIIIAATSIFKMVIDGQRNAVSAQNVQENIRYAMERISKEIRMAKISKHGPSQSERDCKGLFSESGGSINKVFNTKDLGGGVTALYFKNKDDVCVAYFLEKDANNIWHLKIRTRRVSDGTTFEDYITPSSTQVSNLKFYVVDDEIGALHSVQPYVTMVMDIEAVGLAMHKQKMKVQFTVSSRYYE